MKPVVIIGLGTLGLATAKAIKSLNLDRQIYAINRDKNIILSAIKNNIIDEEFNDSHLNIDEYFFINCMPVHLIGQAWLQFNKHEHSTFVDVGSIKEHVIRDSKKYMTQIQYQNYILCHPIAGGNQIKKNYIDVEISNLSNKRSIKFNNYSFNFNK